MAPYTNIPLSPAELSYLHTSLSSTTAIRPDGRKPTDFRTLTAESDILPSANGSARICFADGTEAVVGVKAEIERSSKSIVRHVAHGQDGQEHGDESKGHGEDAWLQVSVDVPGLRDDDALPVFLAAMVSEALLADGELKNRLYINSRFHWRLYVDVLLLSPPLSYPLPLLSLTIHLALLNTRLPALVSQGDEDPLFNDDWAAATPLYPPHNKKNPPITLLVMAVGGNAFYDPSREELAVADAVLAISVTRLQSSSSLQIVSIRTVDPPSRLTASGVPKDLIAGNASANAMEARIRREKDEGMAVWRPPRGGLKRALIAQITKNVLSDGVVNDILDALVKVNG